MSSIEVWRATPASTAFLGSTRMGRLGPAVPSPEERNQRRDHGRSIFWREPHAPRRFTSAPTTQFARSLAPIRMRFPPAFSISFSFNTGDGRCERCAGLGFEKIEMQFLSDLYLRCPECEGRRFQPHVLKIRVRDRSIHDVLEMTVREAIAFSRTTNASPCLSASSPRWVSIIFASVSPLTP